VSTLTITTRKRRGGPRYTVRYRLGGRSYPVQHAGSFKTLREAKARLGIVAGELAVGRNPAVLLASIAAPPAPTPGLRERWDDFCTGKVDVGVKAQAQHGNARDRWVPILGADRDPLTITPADIVGGIAELTKTLKPASIAQYVSTLRQVLDFCDVTPNPVNSPKVKLPMQVREEITPPTSAEWLAILKHVMKRSRLALRLIECCGLRVSEACNLVWGDVDFVEGKIRVARTKTAAGRRWIAVPDQLLDALDALQATEDRNPNGRVLGLAHAQVRADLAKACTDAGVAAHSPHDLRHRRISLWLRHGFDPVSVSRWAGHARTSMSLDVYGHVVLDPADDEWRDFWTAVYDASRRRGVVPVWSEEASHA
jgi:integrase